MTFDIDSIEDETLKAGMQEFLQAQLEGQKATLTEELSGKYTSDIEALQNNSKKILAEKAEEEKRRKQLEGMFGDKTPEQVAEILSGFESDEDAVLLQNGELDKYKQRVAERERTAAAALVEQEAQKTAAEKERSEAYLQQSEQYKKQIHDLTVGTAITSAFIAAGGKKNEKAQEYVSLEAQRWWSINADGKKECRDPATGELVKGKTGLITEAEWVQEKYRPNADFMFEGVQGSGAGGSNQPGNIPFKDLNPQQQADFISEHGVEAALA